MSDDPVTSTPHAAVAPAEVPSLSSLLSLAVGVVVVSALYLGRDVLVPIILAVLLAFVLAPLVTLLRRLKLGRSPSVVLAVLFALGVIGALSGVIGSQVMSLAADVPEYTEKVRAKLKKTDSSALGSLPETVGNISRQIAEAGEGEATKKKSLPGRSSLPIPVEIHEAPPTALDTAVKILSPIVKPFETTIIVLIVAIFVLLQREDVRDRLIRLFGSSDLHLTTTALDDAGSRLSRYFLTQVALNALFGAAIGVGLYFIGIPSAPLWGILAALLRFVPYIGAFLAALPPLLLGAAVDPGWTMVLSTAALFLVAEPIMGYVVEPIVYGHSTGLSPLAIIVAAIFWTWLWGPIGLILSTPVTLCLVVLGRHVKRLEFIDVLFGDRPALTPAEGFYQRMLAGDSDEVLEQAEMLLKERSLTSYYDEVVVGGLRLALADRRRGVLSRQRLAEMANATDGLIDQLSDFDDRDPLPGENEAPAEPTTPPLSEAELHKEPAPLADPEVIDAWKAPGAVVCVPGPGPVNVVLAAILAQLLSKHAIGSGILAPGDVPASHALPRAFCLVHADAKRSRASLKSQLRQLTDNAENGPIIIGLYAQQNEALSPPRTGNSNEFHASSLAQVVSHCISLAQGTMR